MKTARLMAAILLSLQLGACASGVSRPLGKCNESAERRPVSAVRFPGGLQQMVAPAAGAVPASEPEPARPVGRSVIVRPTAPPKAPVPTVPAPIAPTVPSSIELNPLTPTGASLSPRGAPDASSPQTASCNG